MAVAMTLSLVGCGGGRSGGRATVTSTTTTVSAPATPARPSPTASSPEAAIRDYLTLRGLSYAGDCSTTTAAADAGKYCSILQQDHGATRTYLVGPVASEGETVIVARQGRGWRVASPVT